MELKVIFILFLIIICSIACIKCWKHIGHPGNYITLTIQFISFLGIYSVDLLGYTVTGQYLGLRKEVVKLEKQQNELKNITETLVQMVYEIEYQDFAFDETPKPSKRQEERRKKLEALFDSKFEIEKPSNKPINRMENASVF